MSEHSININFKLLNLSELSEDERNLMQRAKGMCDTAYAPYSNFHVGAALLLEDGSVICGSNQENAAYPSGLCAERTAFFAFGATRRETKIKKIAITCRKANSNNYLHVTPCGACRQAMLEYENLQKADIQVFLQAENEKVMIIKSISDLLPFAFSEEHLN
jgi:cytidine deaminase